MVTGVDDILAGDSWVVDVVNCRSEYGRQQLDIREHVLHSAVISQHVRLLLRVVRSRGEDAK